MSVNNAALEHGPANPLTSVRGCYHTATAGRVAATETTWPASLQYLLPIWLSADSLPIPV